MGSSCVLPILPLGEFVFYCRRLYKEFNFRYGAPAPTPGERPHSEGDSIGGGGRRRPNHPAAPFFNQAGVTPSLWLSLVSVKARPCLARSPLSGKIAGPANS